MLKTPLYAYALTHANKTQTNSYLFYGALGFFVPYLDLEVRRPPTPPCIMVLVH